MDDKVAARPTRGAVRRDFRERSVFFFHSANLTVAMGVHDCGTAAGGTGNNSFSIVLSAAPTAATIKVQAMFPSVPLMGIPTMMVLLPPTVSSTINLRQPTVINLNLLIRPGLPLSLSIITPKEIWGCHGISVPQTPPCNP